MRQIILPGNYICMIDDKDYDRIIKYKCYAKIPKHNKNKSAYVYMFIGKKRIFIHRYILGLTDRNIQVDHIDNNGLNNCRSNLRLADNFLNNGNRRLQKNNTTGYKGVIRSNAIIDTYKSIIQISGKPIYLGTYHTKEEAAMAYNKAAEKYFGEYAYLNRIRLQNMPDI